MDEAFDRHSNGDGLQSPNRRSFVSGGEDQNRDQDSYKK
jgi:hypothetical protein